MFRTLRFLMNTFVKKTVLPIGFYDGYLGRCLICAEWLKTHSRRRGFKRTKVPNCREGEDWCCRPKLAVSAKSVALLRLWKCQVGLNGLESEAMKSDRKSVGTDLHEDTSWSRVVCTSREKQRSHTLQLDEKA